uniref:Uncharacterized protein n=1 Tax=Anguilla anguilla TaxID=7936 RepID=A0A0E9S799_ANGAN
MLPVVKNTLMYKHKCVYTELEMQRYCFTQVSVKTSIFR